jgi:hypothetical protein
MAGWDLAPEQSSRIRLTAAIPQLRGENLSVWSALATVHLSQNR